MRRAFCVFSLGNEVVDCLSSIRKYYPDIDLFVIGDFDQSIKDQFTVIYLSRSSEFDKLKSIKKINFDKILVMNSNFTLLENIDDYFNFDSVTLEKKDPSSIFVLKPNADHFENISEIYKKGFDENFGWNGYGKHQLNQNSIGGILTYYFGLLLNSINFVNFEKIKEI